MKNLLFILLFSTGILMGAPSTENFAQRKGKAPVIAAKANKAEVVRVVPHMAVNEEWVSELTIRSDSEFDLQMTLAFYDEDGRPVVATFYDSQGYMYTAEGITIPLFAFEIYSLDFDQLQGARNMQVYVFTDETDTGYGLEAAYHRLSGTFKTASVGVSITAPGDIFIMNLDHRDDPNTGNRRFRGMAITNVDGIDCNCRMSLYDSTGSATDTSGVPYATRDIPIPANGKWVGTSYGLVSDIDNLLADGLGYMLFECDNPASVLGLAFENNSPIATSVPIDYFVVQKTKDGTKRVRRK